MDSPGKNSRLGSRFFLQGIFPTWVSRIEGRFFTIWTTLFSIQVPLNTIHVGKYLLDIYSSGHYFSHHPRHHEKIKTRMKIVSILKLYSVQFSYSVISNSLQPGGLQHTRPPCPSTPRACSNSCPPSWWCHPTISSSVVPFSSWLQSFPASGSSKWVSSFNQVAKILELQHQSFQWIFRTHFLQDGLAWSPSSPRNSQESSPTPQFKSIDSSALSFLYSPTLTSIHDY